MRGVRNDAVYFYVFEDYLFRVGVAVGDWVLGGIVIGVFSCFYGRGLIG